MGFDIERLAAVTPAVDEAAVQLELERYLAGVWVAEPWTIETVGQADWALRMVGEVRARERDYADQVALWEDARRRIVSAADWLEDRLKEWAVERRTDRAKSQPLAHGTVRTREQAKRIEIVDEAAALGWARRSCPAAIRTTERLLVSKVGDHAWIMDVIVGYEAIDKATGEVEVVDVDPTPYSDAAVAKVRERMPGCEVRPIVEDAVLDAELVPVPGLAVLPAEVTATVVPLIAELSP